MESKEHIIDSRLRFCHDFYEVVGLCQKFTDEGKLIIIDDDNDEISVSKSFFLDVRVNQ